MVHALVAAPAGAGKGVGVILTMLTYPGATVLLDVKGENHNDDERNRR
jgi:type IV secretion system protein VirD4